MITDSKNGSNNKNHLTSREQLIKMLLPEAYMPKEKLIDAIERTELWTIMPQAFNLRNLECYTDCRYTDAEIVIEAEKLLSELIFIKKHPDSIDWSIDSLKCSKSLKNKIKGLLHSGIEGMKNAISELIMINLNNYQADTKEIIERLILLVNINDISINRCHHDSPEFLNALVELQHISAYSFNDFYKPFMNETHFNCFINKIESAINDNKAHRLINSLDAGRWDCNEEKIRKSITSGPEYINMQTGKCTGFSVPLKIMAEFGEDYIPAKTQYIKYLKNIIHNYFTQSPWKRHASFLLKYYILHHRMNRLRFEFCKDSSMSLRFVAGSDCTEGMDLQLSDPASAFYKIVFCNNWIGYISLLSVKTLTGYKAVLIDVINIRETRDLEDFNISNFFDNFVDSFIENSGITGFKYLLITTHDELLSNSKTCEIYYKYKNYPRIDGPLLLYRGENKEYALDYLKVFQSLTSDSFIIVRDLEYDRQGILPGFE